MSDFITYRSACAKTIRLLKNEKRKNLKRFCSNLNPFYPIQHLWSTAKHSLFGHECLIYADDLVVFSLNKSLDLAIANLNCVLKDLNDILIKVSFDVTPEKFISVIFTRRSYLKHLNTHLNNNNIPFFSNVTYLDIILDPKHT